ncbi:MAG: c-type cytochrome, partial [Gammaproteobacteria bacterium]
ESHSEQHKSVHWEAPQEEALRTNPVESTAQSIKQGRKLYIKNCYACHGVHARGDGSMAKSLVPQPTNLRKMSGKHADGELAWKIANGRGAMPGWKDVYSENQIWDMVNYIQSLSQGHARERAERHEEHHDEHAH